MRWKLLAKTLWNHHRKATLGAVGAVTLLALVLTAVPLGSTCGSGVSRAPDDTTDARRSRLLLDRVWFDRYPEDARDEISIWIYISSGVGLYQQGSSYRASYDIFEFVRNDRDLELTFLQDEEEASTRFEVERCDEAPPFDLCLTLESPARGPQRYYGFSDESALSEHLPWAADDIEEARQRTRR